MSFLNNWFLACFIMLFNSIAISSEYKYEVNLLPKRKIFSTPIADLKWPGFSMGYGRDHKDSMGNEIWHFGFGENIPLCNFIGSEDVFEIGIQAGTYSIMDITKEPTKLINTDYRVGLGLSYKSINFIQLFQVYHQSSHVGDELLLSSNIKQEDRINLSYESFKYRLKYQPEDYSLSPYIGFDYIFNIEPKGLKKLNFEAGIDYIHKSNIFKHTKFISGAFISAWQENNYSPTYNVRAGFQVNHKSGYIVRIMLEHTAGKLMEGQFYDKKTSKTGVMLILMHS